MNLSPLRRSDPDYFEFEWLSLIASPWIAGRDYAATDIVQPAVPMGFYAQCTTAGESAAREPRWRAEAGATAVDGSVVWTMLAPGSVALASITASSYTITPAGITQSNDSISGTRTSVKLNASAASLGKYLITAEITAGGEDYSLEADLEVVD